MKKNYKYQGRRSRIPRKDDSNIQIVSGNFPKKDISCVISLVDSGVYKSKSAVMVEAIQRYVKEEKQILKNFEVIMKKI